MTGLRAGSCTQAAFPGQTDAGSRALHRGQDVAKQGTQNQKMEIAVESQNLDVFCMGTMSLPSTQKPGNKVLCLIQFSPATSTHAYTSFIF